MKERVALCKKRGGQRFCYFLSQKNLDFYLNFMLIFFDCVCYKCNLYFLVMMRQDYNLVSL